MDAGGIVQRVRAVALFAASGRGGKLDFIVTGTGRCGTGYIAKVLTSAGAKCTHEGVFNLQGWGAAIEKVDLRREHRWWGWRGDSSWLAAPFLGRPELDDLTVVHLVRHPEKVIRSYLRLMGYGYYGPYFRWMAQFIPEIERYDKPDERAAYWYIRLNEMVEARANLFHRIEDDARELLDKLQIDYEGKELFSDTSYNHRTGFGPAKFDLEELPDSLRDRLVKMADRYGYEFDEAHNPLIEAGWMDGVNVIIDTRSAFIGGGWQLRDSAGKPLAYDAKLIEFFLKQIRKVENPIVIDVGANTGSFAMLPLLHPGATVHAFEPNPLAFQLLQSNLTANGLEDAVQLYQMAVADRDGDSTLLIPVNAIHAAFSCLADGTPRRNELLWREEPVKVCKLDSLPIKRVDFIKIDTEGAELLVLRGGERLIRSSLPKILLEFTPLNTRQFGYEPEALIELLKSWGYTSFQREGIEDLWAEP